MDSISNNSGDRNIRIRQADTTMSRKRLSLILIMIIAMSACFFGITGCAKDNAQEKYPPVTVQLKWTHQAQFAGIYVAEEKGFYADEGFDDMTLLQFDPKENNYPIDAVESGTAQFGITGASEFLIAKSEGKAEHVKAVAVIYKVNPICLYSIKDKGIARPSDIQGKRIGIRSSLDGRKVTAGIIYDSMVSKMKLNSSTIIEIANESDMTQEILNGNIDVASGYIFNEPYRVIEAGKEVNTILLAEYGTNMYGDIIIANTEMIKNNPEMIRRFLKASLDGWRYTITNMDETIDITLRYTGNQSDHVHQKTILQESTPLINTGEESIGAMTEKEWENANNLLAGEGIIPTAIPLAEIYTNEFVEMSR